MKLDEFAFLNQQLAAMLREGLPLEGALRQLSATMHRGALRTEIETLEGDLARGTPLAEALKPRQLPELYKRLVGVGAQSQDLPGVLTLLADYYQEQYVQWTRFKGLMTYPVLVLVAVFGLSLMFHFLVQRVFAESSGLFFNDWYSSVPTATRLAMPLLQHSWVFPLGFGLMLVAAALFLSVPGLRDWLRWRVPAFREAGLAKIARVMSLLLDRAVPLPEAVALVEKLETAATVQQDLRIWQQRLAQGTARFTEIAANCRSFPPLFIWLASNAGVTLAEGFRKAADIYRARAIARSEIMMHAALPVAVLMLGLLIATQATLMLSGLLVFMQMLGDAGGVE